MRLIPLLFCILAAFAGCGEKPSSSQSASLLAPRDLGPAPDFSLPAPDGTVLRLSDYRGKTVLLNFWATWCPPCRQEIPEFIRLYERYQGKGLEIIGISLDQGGAEEIKEFIKEFGVNYPIAMGDSDIIRAYGGIRAIPTSFLVNAEGRIVKKYVGAYPVTAFEKDIADFTPF